MFKSFRYSKIGRVKQAVYGEGPAPTMFVLPTDAPVSEYNKSHGIMMSGAGGTTLTSIEKSTYSTETNATNTNTTTARYYVSGVCSSNNPMACGGFSGAETQINVFNISGDSVATSGNVLTTGRGITAGGQGSVYGYVLGGLGDLTSTDKITLSNQTVAAGPTISGRAEIGVISAANALFAAGSRHTMYSNVVQKIVFATSTATTAGTLAVAARNGNSARAENNLTFGYYIGGDVSSGNRVTSADKYVVATETASTLSSILSSGTAAAMTQGSTTKVYHIGGYAASPVSTAIGITTSTDSAATVTGMNGVVVRYGAGGG